MQEANEVNGLGFSGIGTNWGWLTILIVGQGLQFFIKLYVVIPGLGSRKHDQQQVDPCCSPFLEQFPSLSIIIAETN